MGFLPTLDIDVDGLYPVIWIPAGVRAAVAHIHWFDEQVDHPTLAVVIHFHAALLKEKPPTWLDLE